mgnify:CR=1
MPIKAWAILIGSVVLSGLIFGTFTPLRAIFALAGCVFGMWVAWKDQDRGWIAPFVVGAVGVIYFIALLFGKRLW